MLWGFQTPPITTSGGVWIILDILGNSPHRKTKAPKAVYEKIPLTAQEVDIECFFLWSLLIRHVYSYVACLWRHQTLQT